MRLGFVVLIHLVALFSLAHAAVMDHGRKGFLPPMNERRATPVIDGIGCSTNAECMRKGLPLLKPSKRTKAKRAGASATPLLAPILVYPAGSSGPNTGSRKRGYGKRGITTAPANSLGYISAQTLNIATNGWYSNTVTTSTSALMVNVNLNTGTQSMSTTSSASIPYLCAVFFGIGTTPQLGYSSASYAYISNCANAGIPGSVASINTNAVAALAKAETAIWNVDSTTGRLTVSWTNPAGIGPSTVTPDFVYEAGAFLACTGNSTSFITSQLAAVTSLIKPVIQVVELYVELP
ncbi:hypothetical protein BD324DRAFT_182834 [Kockovaella imperatae]|uniref:Uncharacterized protein n=1 Tax=Kockovaella imperatae TaxID=4999 RepID=A0A1Y1U7C7_9TREE|nr:hypothetical protein BD324DRAFT_182834 [Kockovaella imperatae]ORX33912.1 hypothetical protein BD324DRAFT_182834 [Kockovaella imperatae]